MGVAVTDLERSLAFYERVGFAVEDREPQDAVGDGAGWGRPALGLPEPRAAGRPAKPGPGRQPPGFDHVSLAVADVDAACERITASGLELESPPADRPDWGYRAASLLDPDGNRVFLLGALSG